MARIRLSCALTAFLWLGGNYWCVVVESFVLARISTSASAVVVRQAKNDQHEEPPDDGSIPQLPAFQSHKAGPGVVADESGSNQQFQAKPFVASRKFQLQYTCKVCETRNSHAVSRIAYLKGVVIARCKGCDSQHLISDNLGYTGGFPNKNETTIEEHFAGGVSRVSKEVFDLEQIMHHDADSGSILGDNGELALE